ncbi:hypothetical protein [Streptomyces sp. NBC_00096]|uniref:hypothetical protein n=1 Tax=Streptomyces sp. NBC_00096 TaxID=2975650 RepID=UPI003869388C
MGGGPEGAEDDRGLSDRLQPLAADVADQQPGAGGGAGGRVQVSADLGLGLGRQVHGGDPQRAHPLAQGP